MKKQFHSRLKTKGFTLIELLVVIAIISLLSSIVLVSLKTARIKGRDAQRISDVRQMQAALELYYLKNGAYPTYDVVTVDASHTNPLCKAAVNASKVLVTAGLLGAVQRDPSDDGQNTCYKYDSGGAVLGTSIAGFFTTLEGETYADSIGTILNKKVGVVVGKNDFTALIDVSTDSYSKGGSSAQSTFPVLNTQNGQPPYLSSGTNRTVDQVVTVDNGATGALIP